MKVYPLLLGAFDNSRSVLFRNGSSTEKGTFFSYAFYLQDGEDGIMVDTGFGDYKFCNEELGYDIRPYEKTLTAQLEQLGVSPKDITTVILTHCHWDHIGNLGLFCNAKIICQRDEIPWCMFPPDWLCKSYAPLYAHLVYDARDRLELIDGDYTFSGNIRLTKVAGHSPGSQLVEIKGDKKDIIIAGDTLFYFDNLDQNIPNGEVFCLDETMRTLQYFKGRMRERPGTVVLPGHDPKLWERYKKEGFLEV